MGKVLVAYYSHSGNTEKLAKCIAGLTKGDLLEIRPAKPYPKAYGAVVAQAKEEIGRGYAPALAEDAPGLMEYDGILVGTPNWWSTMAPPVKTFLEQCGLEGKKAAVFATHGGGSAGSIQRDFAALCGGAHVTEGFFSYGGSFREKDVERWLKENGWI